DRRGREPQVPETDRLTETGAKGRRSRIHSGGRLAPREATEGIQQNKRRLLKPRKRAAARKEGAHGGTRWFPRDRRGYRRRQVLVKEEETCPVTSWGSA